jgi:CDP-paratose 2-epimerase
VVALRTAVVTGSGGLIGSEAVAYLAEAGWDVIGIENDMRSTFFGSDASTYRTTQRLTEQYSTFHWASLDIRDEAGVRRVFERRRREIELVVHAAAQPSHDWAASNPRLDFDVNAVGTLNLLEAVRQLAPDATFIFTSTNKVYGDRPNELPLQDAGERLDLPARHRYFRGIDTSMTIDRSMHSIFGASKVAADLMVQEYGRYFGIPTVCFRCGCLTGPDHAGAELHGFLAYLMKCTVTGAPYTVFGYDGKQVRDNIHASDVVRAFAEFLAAPRTAAVYNLGGGRASSCSVREAIAACERIADRALDWELSDQARTGDHRWWITDLSEWERDYPEWQLEYDLESTLREIHDQNVDLWTASALPR